MTKEQIKRRLKVTRIKSVLPLGCPKGHGALLVCVSSPFPLLFWEHFSKDRSCRAGQQTTQFGSLLISLARTTTWFVWCILSVFFSACLWGQLSECHAANHRIFADKNNTVCFLVHIVYRLWCRLSAAHGSRVTTHLNTTILHTEEKGTWPNTHTHTLTLTFQWQDEALEPPKIQPARRAACPNDDGKSKSEWENNHTTICNTTLDTSENETSKIQMKELLFYFF